MNCFILDTNPWKCATYIDDVRLPKMIVESAQMMASGLRKAGLTDEDFIEYGILTKANRPYKGAYKHHPVTIWIGLNHSNYSWHRDMAISMLNEYTKRFGKIHACEVPIRNMAELWNEIPYGEMTPFAQAMPDEYKDEDAVKAYRAYYQSKVHSKGGVRYVRTSYPDWWGAAV